LKIYTASEFAHREWTVDWAVENLVPAYGLNFIYAHPKVGKSIWSCQLAHSLSTGRPFLEQQIRQKDGKWWKVLYVQADEPAQEWSHQLREIGVHEGWDTLHFGPNAFKNPKQTEFTQTNAKNYDYLILDSLTSLFGELNTVEQAAHCLNIIGKVCGEIPTLVIHHKRKGQAGIPDHAINSMAGNFALAARGSALYNLSEKKLEARGRLVKVDLPLERTASGLWIVDHNSSDFYKD
jgi:RecA-family ATPase